jgi:hypothetical protein
VGDNQLILKQEHSKTFTFDKVFGPGDSQEKVFNEVALGMLSEVRYHLFWFCWVTIAPFLHMDKLELERRTQWKAI